MNITKRFRKNTEKIWVKPMFGELLYKNQKVFSGKRKIAGRIPERSLNWWLQTFYSFVFLQ